MTTALQVCTRSLRRLAVIDALATPSAQDATVALDALNEMMAGWAARGVDLLLQDEFDLADTVEFWVPPVDLESDTIALARYIASWDATVNSPALGSGVGTQGYIYKVCVAGSTALDDVTSWAVNDYAVYDGTEWLKGRDSSRFIGTVVAMLARRLADEFGMPVPLTVESDAIDGWRTLQGYYIKPPKAGFDRALLSVPSRTVTGLDSAESSTGTTTPFTSTISIAPGAGAALFAGTVPTVSGTVFSFGDPGVGAASWTGPAPSVGVLGTAPSVGAATWTGPAPTVTGLTSLSAIYWGTDVITWGTEELTWGA